MHDNLKIGYLCSDVGIPVLGFMGCSVHVREMVNALAGLGSNISVFAPSKGKGNQFPHKIIDSKRFKKKWIGRDLRLILSNMNFYRACRKQFKVHRPHFIYERYGLYGWAGVKLSREFSIPLIVEINTLLTEEEKDRLHFPGLARIFEGTILRHAEAVCSPSKIMRSLLLERGVKDEKILVTPNGVNLIDFSSNQDGREIRKRYGLDKKLLVGYIGVIKKLWGIYTILESAREVLSQSNDFHFIVVGEGKDYSDMKRFLEKNNLTDSFTLTGGVPHHDIAKYIDSIDIGLAPYCRKEPFHGSAMKLFEYMACEKPVISTDLPGVKAVADNKVMYVSNGKGYKEKIVELYKSKGLRREMGETGRVFVEGNYDWVKIVERMERILLKVGGAA